MNFINFFLVLMLIGWPTVNSQCMSLIRSFYTCPNLPVNLLFGDIFYNNSLAGYDSFDAAFDLFKQIYVIMTDCYTNNCTCIRQNLLVYNYDRSMSYNADIDYSFMFLNDSNFNDSKAIVKSIKDKYKPRRLKDINNDINFLTNDALMVFDDKFPWLSAYCMRYEYSYVMEYIYDELKNCHDLTRDYMDTVADCVRDSLAGGLLDENEETERIETVIKCKLKNLNSKRCPIEIKQFIALNSIAANPQIQKGRLLTYIQSLIVNNATKSTFSFYNFKLAFLFLFVSRFLF